MPAFVDRPRRWDLRFIGRFMVEFGVLRSLFDVLTFGALLGFFAATPELFRTGWFVESLLTELVIALVVRTRRPLFQSRPGTLLLASTLAVTLLTFVIPVLPFGSTGARPERRPRLPARRVLARPPGGGGPGRLARPAARGTIGP